MWTDVKEDKIFWDFIISANLNLSLPAIEAEAFAMKEKIEGIDKTNVNGYHSPLFNGRDKPLPSIYHEFKKLQDLMIGFTNLSLAERHYKVAVSRFSWWANINPPKGYNNLHHHGNTDIIGVYYIKIPENSGLLHLARNDGSTYGTLYKNIPGGNQMNVNPEVNRFYIMPGHLWHWVTENNSEETRISVAINMHVEDIVE